MCVSIVIFQLQHIQKDLVSQSGQLGMIRQLNVKLQEAVVSKVTDFSVVNKDIKKLEKKWESVSKLIDERFAPLIINSLCLYVLKLSSTSILS